MRLLNAKTLTFEEFFDDTLEPYVILSHRWYDHKQEVSYRDFLDRTKTDTLGYAKIVATAEKALAHRFEWIWVDTCCIDKTSSAELTEAINSMFRWYQGARECYVYLNDVEWTEAGAGDSHSTTSSASSVHSSQTHLAPPSTTSHGSSNNNKTTGTSASREAFRRSDWHKRGWTLQELLAPQNVIFYDKKWRFIGKKEKLAVDIAQATGIRLECLFHNWALSAACIAERMSWAAKRQCSRIEDNAYSLLGIFNVNMPLLYGEGKRAFLRLQEEIVKKSDDESIFAWTASIPDFGLLAPSAAAFIHSRDVRSWAWEDDETRRPYAMTNKGLEVHLPNASLKGLTQTGLRAITAPFSSGRKHVDDVKLPLNCSRRVDGAEQRISLVLSKTSGGWRRVQCDTLSLSIPPPVKQSSNTDAAGFATKPLTHTIYVRQDHTRTNGAPSASATTDGLPGGWEMRHTPNGRPYYVNHHTRSTSWVHPAGIGSDGGRSQRGEKGPKYQSVLGSDRSPSRGALPNGSGINGNFNGNTAAPAGGGGVYGHSPSASQGSFDGGGSGGGAHYNGNSDWNGTSESVGGRGAYTASRGYGGMGDGDTGMSGI